MRVATKTGFGPPQVGLVFAASLLDWIRFLSIDFPHGFAVFSSHQDDSNTQHDLQGLHLLRWMVESSPGWIGSWGSWRRMEVFEVKMWDVESFDPKVVEFLCLFFVGLRRSLVKNESEVYTKKHGLSCFFH